MDEDLDNPTALPPSDAGPSAPSLSSVRTAPSTNAARDSAGGGDDSDAEDEMPDYLRLAALTAGKRTKGNSNSRSNDADDTSNYRSDGGGGGGGSSSSSNAATVVIPKRGEKDFEPTGFGGQSKLLERSRDAMVAAISGERRIMNKGLTTASWDASLNRAVVHELQGKLFETTGQIAKRHVLVSDPATGEQKLKTVSRNELLPEEALFMLERGSLLLYARPIASSTDSHKEPWRQAEVEPVSLQQAFAMMVGRDGLTRERYQVYVYLKRLGYVVQRAEDVDRIRSERPTPASTDKKRKKQQQQQQQQMQASTQAQAEATSAAPGKTAENVSEKGILADPRRPLKLVNDLDLLLYIPRRMAQLLGDAVRWLSQWLRRITGHISQIASHAVARSIGQRSTPTGAAGGSATSATSLLGLSSGRQRGLLGRQTWNTYNGVYESLQIVPSGHDRHLPPLAPSSSSPSPYLRSGSNRSDADALAPFYYAWRPATSYRKSHPPAPEFRIAIINAKRQAVPSAWEFQSMFDAVPLPGSLEELGIRLPAASDGLETPTPLAAADAVAATAAAAGEDGDGDDDLHSRLQHELELKRRTEEANKRAYGKNSDGRMRFLQERKRQRDVNRAASRPSGSSQTSRSDPGELGMRLLSALEPVRKALQWWVSRFDACPGCFPSSSSCSSSSRAVQGGRTRSKREGKDGGREPREFTPPSNPFPALKAGRKTVVLAVVDSGVTMLLRFGEAEFKRLRLAGRDGAGEGDVEGGKAG